MLILIKSIRLQLKIVTGKCLIYTCLCNNKQTKPADVYFKGAVN